MNVKCKNVKVIPIDELYSLLVLSESDVVTMETVLHLFEKYGDLYSNDNGLEKCIINTERHKILNTYEEKINILKDRRRGL